MQILILSEETYPRHGGGSGKCSHFMAAGLAARGHTVHLLSQTGGDPVRERIDEVHVHRVAAFRSDRWGTDRADADTARYLLDYLDREIQVSSLDLVHDSGGFLSYYFPLARELKRRGLPVATHFRYLLHGHHMVIAATGRFGPFSRSVLETEAEIAETTQCFPVRIADLIISPSTADVELVRALFRPRTAAVEVLPDAVEPRATAATGDSWRNRLAKPGETLVLFGGRIGSEIKGPDIVLGAFERIRCQEGGVRLVLATADEDAAARFRERLGDTVTSLGWIDDAVELAGLFAAADVVVMPSRYEAFGMMCAEAMAAGTPVVGAPVGGLRDMIAHGENGFLLTGSDAAAWEQSLAESILRLAAAPDLGRALGARARRFAERNLSLEANSARLERLYRRLLESRPASGRDEISPPRLTRRDEKRYLEVLDERAGPDAREAGRALLGEWLETIVRRRLACTRKRIGWDTRRLLRLGGSRRCWAWALPASLRRRLAARAVRQACPLALLQKDMVHRAVPACRPLDPHQGGAGTEPLAG